MKIISTSYRNAVSKWAVAATMGAAVACSGPAVAKLYINFDGIKGESTEANHKDWNAVDSVQWAVSVSTSIGCNGGGGSCAGEPSFSDLTWSQSMDRSFPPLFTRISTGNHIPKVTVDYTHSTGNGEAPIFSSYSTRCC